MRRETEPRWSSSSPVQQRKSLEDSTSLLTQQVTIYSGLMAVSNYFVDKIAAKVASTIAASAEIPDEGQLGFSVRSRDVGAEHNSPTQKAEKTTLRREGGKSDGSRMSAA